MPRMRTRTGTSRTVVSLIPTFSLLSFSHLQLLILCDSSLSSAFYRHLSLGLLLILCDSSLSSAFYSHLILGKLLILCDSSPYSALYTRIILGLLLILRDLQSF